MSHFGGASAGKAGSLFIVVTSLKYLLTSGAKARNSSTERQTCSERILLMTSNALTFDLMGAMYLNWGAGSTDAGVLRSGLAEGA